ncbi:hypothetical protein AAGR08_04485 [Pantoea sp. BRR-3P]|uniref:hypothetical protein n=1 Tax=Pantoea sp. BRR-3P TaxID=3141541 RepID=UPI0031F4CE55
MDKMGQYLRLSTAFQSKPGKVHAKFSNFEQLYLTLSFDVKQRLVISAQLFNFLLQFFIIATIFSFHLHFATRFACRGRLVKIERAAQMDESAEHLNLLPVQNQVTFTGSRHV